MNQGRGRSTGVGALRCLSWRHQPCANKAAGLRSDGESPSHTSPGSGAHGVEDPGDGPHGTAHLGAGMELGLSLTA